VEPAQPFRRVARLALAWRAHLPAPGLRARTAGAAARVGGGARAALLVALAGAAAASCTGAGGTDASEDAKAGAPSVSFAQPGRYSTLREPCGAVPSATLKSLLPPTASLPADQQARVLGGTPAVTYDTDRLVGCSWKANGPDASYTLSVSIQRVVSYDPSVSDAERAQQVYEQQQEAASDDPSTDAPTLPPLPTGSQSPSAPGGAPGGSASTDAGPLPSSVDGIGDEAYVDDRLSPSGSAGRAVDVVFRTSNVVVTIAYTEQPTRTDTPPAGKELQAKAEGLARNLVDAINQ
jgi:hypothetical protein